MANKYFIKKGNHEGYNFVEVDEDNVSYKIYINELVYVKERHIDDVTAYRYGDHSKIDADAAYEYILAGDDMFTDEEIKAIKEGNAAGSGLENAIIEKMKMYGISADLMPVHKVIEYPEGTEMKEAEIDRWLDVTDKFDGMEEICRETIIGGCNSLYKLKDGRKIYIITLDDELPFETIYFVPEYVETIRDAERYITEDVI